MKKIWIFLIFSQRAQKPRLYQISLRVSPSNGRRRSIRSEPCYSKSGLGFVLTPSIAKKWGGLHNGFWIFPPFWQSWNSGKTSIIEDRSVFREILVCGASETKNKVPIGLEIKFCIFGTILSLLAKAIDFWRFAGGLVGWKNGIFVHLSPRDPGHFPPRGHFQAAQGP